MLDLGLLKSCIPIGGTGDRGVMKLVFTVLVEAVPNN
jgi:hypothetical protein